MIQPKPTIKLPFFAQVALVLLGLFALVSMLFFGGQIIVPVIYAIILAIVLNPVVNFFVQKKINRVVAIAITVFLTMFTVIFLVALLSSQLMQFSAAFPKLGEKFNQLSEQTINWASHRFSMSTQKINGWVTEKKTEVLSKTGSVLALTLLNTGSVLIVLFLIPVYVFMILYYRPLLIEFVHKLFSNDNQGEVNDILKAIKVIIQSYLVGLLVEACIIATLNSASLLLLGIESAILIGIIGAVLNVIPYIGGIIAVALPMVMALVTKSPTYALLVLGAYLLIQFIDNHLIIPKVVASKVKINALISVIVVLAGNALWGIAGMFLSIPLTAIIKVICDHVEPLKPLGFLLGNTVPTTSRFSFIKSKPKQQKV